VVYQGNTFHAFLIEGHFKDHVWRIPTGGEFCQYSCSRSFDGTNPRGEDERICPSRHPPIIQRPQEFDHGTKEKYVPFKLADKSNNSSVH
jgi:hypothetical protein